MFFTPHEESEGGLTLKAIFPHSRSQIRFDAFFAGNENGKDAFFINIFKNMYFFILKVKPLMIRLIAVRMYCCDQSGAN